MTFTFFFFPLAVVYRYVDLHDEVIKYVGIVWSENRTLKQRIKEHSEQDDWCIGGCWRVEYLQKEVKSRIDAELLEAHYISKFKTNEWYNVSKANWGTSELLQDDPDEEWKEYETIGNIKPSDMIEAYEEGFAYIEDGYLHILDEKRDYILQIGFHMIRAYPLIENPNIYIPSHFLLAAILYEIDWDESNDEDFNCDKMHEILLDGEMHHFSTPIKVEYSEISGKIIRLQIGQTTINASDTTDELFVTFDSVREILSAPCFYSIAASDTKKYDDFQLSDLEKELGLTSTDQDESAERK